MATTSALLVAGHRSRGQSGDGGDGKTVHVFDDLASDRRGDAATTAALFHHCEHYVARMALIGARRRKHAHKPRRVADALVEVWAAIDLFDAFVDASTNLASVR